MKTYLLLFSFVVAMLWPCGASAQFEHWFYDKTLRMDFYHVGDALEEGIVFDELLEEPYWGGSKKNLIDTMLYGNYYVNVFDVYTNQLLYSRGFCTLFGEWRDTEEAQRMKRAYPGSVVMPFPKENVRVEIAVRNNENVFDKLFEYVVDVKSYFIRKDRRLAYPVRDILQNGDPARCVDLILLPEGYREEEMDRFIEDCKVFAEGLFRFSPYREMRHLFNIRAVLAPALESGVDNPGEGIWKNTLLNSSFYTFDSERYLTTSDFKSVRDMAANAPYDLVYILANTDKYGGGGIYNFYGISSTGNISSVKVHVHEFGHLFAGLGDEYVGTTSYDDMYNLKVEPWEPNITTLVDFGRKWKDMLDKDTPVPTAVNPANPNLLGVYEGAGYVIRGMYRPRPDCLMNTLRGEDFCPVCTRAIVRQIQFYTE